MKNFYLFIAGLAMLAAAVPVINNTTDGLIYEVLVSEKKITPAVKPSSTKQLPYSPLKRKKANARHFLVPIISATNTYALTNDVGLPGGSAGDEIEYTVTISNTGAGATDATGVIFTEPLDANTTLVGSSLKVSPIAQNDSYTTIGNVGLDIPAATGLLNNDISPDAATLSIAGPAAIPTTGLGTVTINLTTGAFTYVPAAGFTGADTFTYILQNGSGMTSTATVTITATGAIWFINAAADPIGANGTLAKPFKSLASFQAINDNAVGLHPKNGHTIFVYTGSYTGPITLLSQQKLVGQGAGATLLAISGLAAPSGTNQLPTTSAAPESTRPNFTTSGGTVDAVSVTGANTIRGVNIGNTSGSKIAGTNSGILLIKEVRLTGTGGALNLSGGGLDAEFSEISSSSSSGTTPLINIVGNVTGTLTIPDGTILATGMGAVKIVGNSLAINIELDKTSSSGTSTGVSVSGTTGTFQIIGTGATAGSGGVITNTSARGMEFSNTAGITIKNVNLTSANTADAPSCGTTDNSDCNAAFYANVVNGLTLQNVIISGTTTQHGINLRGVNTLLINNSSVANAGVAPNAAAEGAIFATNMTGNASITNSTFTNNLLPNDFASPSGRVAYFGNTNTNLTLLTVDNCDFMNSPNNGGILMEGYGNSQMKMKITGGSQFLRCQTQGIKMIANNTSQLVGDIRGAIVDNVVGGTNLPQIGIDMHSLGTASLKYNIIGNTLKRNNGPGINLKMNAGSTQEGTVDNNTITGNGAANHGGSGIYFDSEGTSARGIVKISGNVVNGINNEFGVGVGSNVTTVGTRSDVTISGNNLTVQSGAFYDIQVDLPNLAGNKGIICASIKSNAVSNATTTALLVGAEITGTQMIFEGGGANLAALWSGNLNTPSGAGVFQTDGPGVGGTFTYNSGATCTQPNVPALRISAEETAQNRVAPAFQDSVKIQNNEMPLVENKPVIPKEALVKPEKLPVVVSPPGREEGTQAGEIVVVNGALNGGPSGTGFLLPATKNVIIKFRATINANIPTATCQVSTQGTVSGSNFDPDVQTDGPGGTATNPTVTPVTSVPVITACPGDQTFSPDPGTCTSTKTFIVTADGCPAPTITYKVGANPTAFPIASSFAFPAGESTVVVTASNGIGTAPTCTFKVTVTPTPAPPMTDEPDAQTICAGAGTSFTVATSQAGVTYQWQKKPFGGAFANILVGSNPTADDATLTLSNVPVADNKSEYRCIISNPCNNTTSGAAILTVNQITASNLTGTTSVNQGAANPAVTFGATGGTLPYTFSYKINNGTALSVSTTGVLTSVGVTQSTATVGSFAYELISVTDALNCTFTPSPAQTATITVVNNLTATISGATSVCVGAPQPQITFTAVNGIPPFTFNYKLNGGPNIPLTTTGSNTTATVSVPTASAATSAFELVNVSGSGGAATSPTGQTANVVVNAVPTVSLTGAQYECSTGLETYSVFFTATSGATVTSDKGTVVGNSVTGIPSDQSAILTVAQNGCSSTLTVFRNCALPVTLVNFSAARQENTVLLKWSTTAETNSDKFEIQRSADAKNWQAIGTKKSGGESSAVLNYAFTDKEPIPGDNFYRLKMLDTDQTFAYSRIVYASVTGNASMEVYPNPVSDLLSVKATDWSQIKSIEIHNLVGTRVYKSENALAKTIRVSSLPTGVYILSMIQKNGQVKTQKILIER